jgi:hypothetical protein
MDPARGARGRGVLVLPAEGRKGVSPKWPMPDPATPAEKELWRELWHTPQAVEWERLGWSRELEDRLGLTPKAMRLLLWTISVDEVAEKRQGPSAAETARKRIRAVS